MQCAKLSTMSMKEPLSISNPQEGLGTERYQQRQKGLAQSRPATTGEAILG